MQDRIYLDYAAATPIAPAVREAMLPWLLEDFGNPSSIHAEGVKARAAVEKARGQLAKLLEARPDEIVFTSGATESVNLALSMVAKGDVVFTTPFEHPSHTKLLEAKGADVRFLPCDENGRIIAAGLSEIVCGARMVSFMAGHNETGVLHDVRAIGQQILRISEGERPLFHVDLSQTMLTEAHAPERDHFDLASFSAGKIYGPKGVGALFIKKGVKIGSIFYGGSQERGVRPGTENVAGIVGFGVAAEIALKERMQVRDHLVSLREAFIEAIRRELPETEALGGPYALPSIVSLRFATLRGEEIVLRLDAEGIAAATGSACKSRVGASREDVVRFSFGSGTTEKEVRFAAQKMAEIVQRYGKVAE